MEKIFGAILTAVLITLTACGGEEVPPTDDNGQITSPDGGILKDDGGEAPDENACKLDKSKLKVLLRYSNSEKEFEVFADGEPGSITPLISTYLTAKENGEGEISYAISQGDGSISLRGYATPKGILPNSPSYYHIVAGSTVWIRVDSFAKQCSLAKTAFVVAEGPPSD